MCRHIYNWNIVECDVKNSLTYAPIMENKRFLSIHKIQIQHVNMFNFGISLTDIRERQSCHSVVGAPVNASFFCKCSLHKALLVSVADNLTWTLELQHNQFHIFRRKPLDCKTCSHGYLTEIKSCLDHENTSFWSCAYHKMTFETWNLVIVMLAKVSENRFFFLARGCQNTCITLSFEIWLLIKILIPTIT